MVPLFAVWLLLNRCNFTITITITLIIIVIIINVKNLPV